MSNNYVKKYEVGNIRVDAPGAEFIYELPLLTFSDVLHTVNLSLIYQSKMTDNPFYIKSGYKLSLQKRIIFKDNIPCSYEDGNGKLITLNKMEDINDVFTFSDGSQRIIRQNAGNYILENADYSQEIFNSDGNILWIIDKYNTKILTYEYSGTKLDSIEYRNGKYIEFGYSSSKLQSITYVYGSETICTTNISYLESGIKVSHYSGVDYHITNTDSEFYVFSTDSGDSLLYNYSKSVKCTVTYTSTGKKLYIEKNNGTTTVNTETYYFHISDGQKNNVVDFINHHGVKIRTQYYEDKPIYSYEYDGSVFPNKTEDEDETNAAIEGFQFENDISIFDQQGDIYGKQYYDAGKRMNFDSNGYQWDYDLTDNQGISTEEYVVITGWLKKLTNSTISGETPECRITVADMIFSPAPSFLIGDLPLGEWVYFSIKVSAYTSGQHIENPIVYTNLNRNQVLMTDFRVITQSEIEQSSMGENYLSRVDDVVILETDSGADSIYFPLDLGFEFYNGNSKINEKITANDILKYKINQKHRIHTNEIYCNNCKKVITKQGDFSLKYRSSANSAPTYLSINSLAVGKRCIQNNNTFVVKTNFYDDNTGNSDLITKYSKDGIYYKHICYDGNLDTIASVVDGITNYYVRNSHGLVTSQTILGTNTSSIIISSTFDDSCTKLNTTINEFGTVTEYVTDAIWGTITESYVLDENGSEVLTVTDNFDSDFDDQLSRTFVKDSMQKDHDFAYSEGKISGITDGCWNYNFTYSDSGDLNQIMLNDIILETHQITNNCQTYTTSYNIYSIVENYDKYGRLLSINGRIRNNYDRNPVDNNGVFNTTGINNIDAKLASTEDLVCDTTTKYMYDKDRVVKSATFNSSNTKVDERTLDYDDANRVTKDKYVYDAANSKNIEESYLYVTNESNPLADDRKSNTYYNINGNTVADTTNTFDGLNRLISKTNNVGNNSLKKEYFYTATRFNNVRYTNNGVKIHDYVCGYNKNGQLTYENDYSGNYNNITYYYDPFGQLIRENNILLDKTITYSYNNYGNITCAKAYAYTSGDVEIGSEISQDTYTYDQTNGTKLVSFNGETVTYNTRGYPINHSKNGASLRYGWTSGRLTTVSSNNVVTSIYTYDGYGKRIKKTQYSSSGVQTVTNYTYDHRGRLLKETWGNKEIFYIYDESDVIGMIYTSGGNSKKYLYDKNVRGDVVGIYDSEGNVAAKYTYDAWGNYKIINATNAEIATTNRILYRSYYYDHETKFYYLNARYYNPQWRRFISPDSCDYLDPESPNGLNLYCYCTNDPVNYADPSGHFVDLIFDTVCVLYSIVDLIESPAWSKVGLLALDIFLTVAPVIPAVSGLRHFGKIDDAVDLTKAYGHIDNFADLGGTIRRAEKSDFRKVVIDGVDFDGWSAVKSLENTEDGFTISNISVGKKIHKTFMNPYYINAGNIADGFDKYAKIIFELKPYNVRGIKRGIKQLIRYKKAIEQSGITVYKMVLVLY